MIDKDKVAQIISKLLGGLEEEDICISLLGTQYQNENELAFFNETDQRKIRSILNQLISDSTSHKARLQKIIDILEKKLL